MDLLLYLKVVLLGIVEGLTEFLPISSTGHLIIAENLIRFDIANRETFTIFIQLGAILAVCWEYRVRFLEMFSGLFSKSSSRSFFLNLVIATLPAGIVGILCAKKIKLYLFNPLSVSVSLIVGGMIILYLESRKTSQSRIQDVKQIRIFDAFKVGCAQVLSLIPGVSRAAATIMGAMSVGFSRETATLFSFFLAVPTLLGATAVDLFKNRQNLYQTDVGIFTVGFVFAFLSAFFMIRLFLRYVSSHDFKLFAYYRMILGGTIILLYAMGWMHLSGKH